MQNKGKPSILGPVQIAKSSADKRLLFSIANFGDGLCAAIGAEMHILSTTVFNSCSSLCGAQPHWLSTGYSPSPTEREWPGLTPRKLRVLQMRTLMGKAGNLPGAPHLVVVEAGFKPRQSGSSVCARTNHCTLPPKFSRLLWVRLPLSCPQSDA